MEYFYIIHLNSPKGQFTDIGTIQWNHGETRKDLFLKILVTNLNKHKLPADNAGVPFFYLEPNQ